MDRQELTAKLEQIRTYVAAIAYSTRMGKEDKDKVREASENIENVIDDITFNKVDG